MGWYGVFFSLAWMVGPLAGAAVYGLASLWTNPSYARDDYRGAVGYVEARLQPGDVVKLVVTHEASFGGLHRFAGSGSVAGLECVRGRFYLAEP